MIVQKHQNDITEFVQYFMNLLLPTDRSATKAPSLCVEDFKNLLSIYFRFSPPPGLWSFNLEGHCER